MLYQMQRHPWVGLNIDSFTVIPGCPQRELLQPSVDEPRPGLTEVLEQEDPVRSRWPWWLGPTIVMGGLTLFGKRPFVDGLYIIYIYIYISMKTDHFP